MSFKLIWCMVNCRFIPRYIRKPDVILSEETQIYCSSLLNLQRYRTSS